MPARYRSGVLPRRVTWTALLAALVLAALAVLLSARTPEQASAAPQPCLGDVTVRDGRAVAADYMMRRDGFADEVETTGGLGKRLLRVTSTNDDRRSPGAGTLRHAVETARSEGGGYILFDLSPAAPPIALEAPLRLGPNTTLDGGCTPPHIVDESAGSAFYLDGIRNVILTRLSLTQTGFAGREEGGDCITVRGGADRLWINAVALSACRDGMIDITADEGDRRSRVTISDSEFSDHDKVMLVSGAAIEGEACFARPVREAQLQVSLLRNRFVRVAQRIPRVSGDSFVHLYGNDIAFAPRRRESGEMSGSYGALARDGGRLLSQNNRYRSLDETRRLRGVVASGPQGQGTCRGHGAARSVGDDIGPQLDVREANSSQVPVEDYGLRDRTVAWQTEQSP